jgi:hypothetical protein
MTDTYRSERDTDVCECGHARLSHEDSGDACLGHWDESAPECKCARFTMASDQTEAARRKMVAAINADPGSRESLEALYGQVWDTRQLEAEYEVKGFLAPFVVVKRKSDGQVGSLEFQHHPRFYYAFAEDRSGRR